MEQQARETYRALAERLLSARSVCVLTGAGVSKESGVPTFREADGLWNKFRPEELANVDAFIRNPERIWEWYTWRRNLMSSVVPNTGHLALAELERRLERFTLVTQNIDNLHWMAGSTNVVELHGNIQRNKCHACNHVVVPESGQVDLEFREGELPRCSVCGTGMMRPDVVWFGEMLPETEIFRAWSEAEECDIFLSIGTSAVVYPAAALPQVAKSSGAYLVEINPEATELTPLADLYLAEPSGVALPALVEALQTLDPENR